MDFWLLRGQSVLLLTDNDFDIIDDGAMRCCLDSVSSSGTNVSVELSTVPLPLTSLHLGPSDVSFDEDSSFKGFPSFSSVSLSVES